MKFLVALALLAVACNAVDISNPSLKAAQVLHLETPRVAARRWRNAWASLA